MSKFLTKYIDFHLIKGCLAFAIVYSLLFNSMIFWQNLQEHGGVSGVVLITAGKEFLYLNIFLLVMFVGLSVHNLLFTPVVLGLFIFSAINNYYWLNGKEFIFTNIFQFDAEADFAQVVNLKLVFWVIFCVGIFFYLFKHFKVQSSNLFFTKLIAASCLFIVANNIVDPQFSFVREYAPGRILYTQTPDKKL